jgi:hypothetical protein
MKSLTNVDELTPEDKVRLMLDFFHRTMIHHALWYGEVAHQYGRERALEVMEAAWENSSTIQLQRLSKIMGFELTEGLPTALINQDPKQSGALLSALAVDWLATDGVWFQAVEAKYGMMDAKRCNDSCWAQFSPFEAWSVKRLLNLEEGSGLEGLKKALQFRLYAYINKQSITDETKDSFIFRMDECRVQVARRRKGMDDYPCKSGGLVEFTEFARAIDIRIQTTCVACPPDNTTEVAFCAWKFSLAE